MKPIVKRTAAWLVGLALCAGLAMPASAEKPESCVLTREVSYTGVGAERFIDADAYRGGISVAGALLRKNGAPSGGEVSLGLHDKLEFSVQIPEDGDYTVAFDFVPVDAKINDALFTFTADGKTLTARLPILWRDAEQQYRLDRDGEELPPQLTAVDTRYCSVLEDYTDYNRDLLVLSLTAGTHSFVLTDDVQPIRLYGVYLKKETDVPDYQTYMKGISGDPVKKLTTVEGERYAVVTSTSVKGTAIKNQALSPYETRHNRINTLSGSWKAAGDSVVYEFTVPKDGKYAISFRYLQNADTNMTVYRDMLIDGRTLFSEMRQIAFPPTKSNTFENYTLKVAGKPAYVFLTAGVHTMTLRATMGPLEEQYKKIIDLMNEINAFGMDINKLSSSTVDENRTWDTEAYIPDAVPRLKGFADSADGIYAAIKKLSVDEPVYANDMQSASRMLRKIAATPRTIPNKAEDISMGDSSASKYLGTVVGKLTEQALSVDRIFLGGTELPGARVPFFRRLAEGIRQFIFSFAYEGAAERSAKNDKELKVWMNNSIPYVQVMQQVTDDGYNAAHGTDIEISVMAGEQKLILANAAGTTPDVVLGAGVATCFSLAVRGAAKNFLDFNDFLPFYNEHYNLETLIPTCYNDGVYGAVETQGFQLLFYRKDILDSLGLGVPETWDDIREMMPLLLRYNMNVSLPLSGAGAMKPMGVTGPFMYQNKAEFYEKDGTKVAFDAENGIKAFSKMTELYSIYSVQKAVASFYNSFRYGEIPVGVGDFAFYLQLELAAPELAGRWGVALVPGERQEDGSILRFQSAAGSAAMIPASTRRADEAWQFIKWWLSTDTQVAYAEKLLNTYGSGYRWNPANLDAFAQLSFPEELKKLVLEQWTYQKENVPHVASYMVDRETSNIWNNIVVNGDGLVEAIDTAAIPSNREIIKKLQEFGYCDAEGRVLHEYKIMTYNRLVELLKEGAAE